MIYQSLSGFEAICEAQKEKKRQMESENVCYYMSI
jgi:hypothetical protein